MLLSCDLLTILLVEDFCIDRQIVSASSENVSVKAPLYIDIVVYG